MSDIQSYRAKLGGEWKTIKVYPGQIIAEAVELAKPGDTIVYTASETSDNTEDISVSVVPSKPQINDTDKIRDIKL